MKLAEVSIRRPVFASMMIGAIVVFGWVLYRRLRVDMYPEVNFPVVTVTAVYPGASPATVETQLAKPLEEAVNSLSGIESLRSISLDSVAQVIVEFSLDVDVAQATQDVRERVAAVQSQLPADVEAPMVQKLDLGAAPIMQLALSGAASESALLRYAEDELKPAVERISGVGQVEIVGGRKQEMHVWLRPEALTSYGLTLQDLARVVGAQNIELPGGRVEVARQEVVLRTDERASTPGELGQLIVATRNGAVTRLSDIATIEDGFEEPRSLARVNGESAIALVVRKQSDANTVEVASALTGELPALRARAPSGTDLRVLVDNSTAIRASIETVQLDLVLGALLAVVIIFLFLRDPRATFISALALPTSVIGAFGFVKAMGFTLNMMTTLALSLSIGILIDDAIVVIENIVRRRTALRETALEAASRGTAEIGLAVLATTLSIVAVFVPVAFMDGMVGQFFYQFGLTVAFAVLLSLFVSFTLTPMLSARLLKGAHAPSSKLSMRLEAAFTWLDETYRRIIRWALTNRWKTLGGAVGALVGAFALVPLLGFEFVPPADVGQFSVKLELPPGTPLSETARRAEDIAARLRSIPGFTSTFTTVGGGVQERVDTAELIVSLVDRSARHFTQEEAMAHVRKTLANEPRLLASVEPLQMVGGAGGRNAPIRLELRGEDLEELSATAERIAGRLRALPGFVDVDTTYRAGKPEFRVDIDRQRAADLGVLGAEVAMAVRSWVAGQVATQVESHGTRYDVRLQLPPDLRKDSEARFDPELRTSRGALVPLSSVAKFDGATGPNRIERQARQREVAVLANLQDLALGGAVAQSLAVASEEASSRIHVEMGGNGKRLQDSMRSMLFALLLAVACVYMILASQFESFIHPFTIMASLPFALIGAFGGLLLAGMHMSIFAMIGLIMLMGLVTKNAILLVDFVIQRRKAGDARDLALENAGATRLRPILMTTAAMVFGMLPVALGHGSGGEVRAPMGVTIIGGLITSTALTLVVVPVLYTVMDGLIERLRALRERVFAKAPRSVLEQA